MDELLLSRRRAFLERSSSGMLGSIALSWLTARGTPAAAAQADNLTGPHQPPKAKQVICPFQNGGPSQMDLFDEKPELTRVNGKPYPGQQKVETFSPSASGNLLGSPFAFGPAGQCGMQLSDIIPHISGIADEISVVRSMATESVCHETALRIAHSGHPLATDRPSMGSWPTYGLGSGKQNLPTFVVLPDQWHSQLVRRLVARAISGHSVQRGRYFKVTRAESGHAEMEARLRDFETAARLQAAVPSAVDLSHETKATQQMYGLDQWDTKAYGTRCLLARRLIEQGLRFVGVYLRGQPWDTHADNANVTKKVAAGIDQPSAALVRDLKARSLLDSTLVVWM
jgi:hypothetical protein